MSLKKLSFILLTLLCFNAYSMEEQKNTEPIDQVPASEISEVKTLQDICAEQILKNDLTEETSKALNEDLKGYLQYFKHFKELEGHQLAPAFKKYLIECFEYMPLQILKDLLNIVDRANKISFEKSIFTQKNMPLSPCSFFSKHGILAISSALKMFFPTIFANLMNEVIKEQIEIYENIEIKTQEAHGFLLEWNLISEITHSQIVNDNFPSLAKCVLLAKNGSSHLLYRIGMIHAALSPHHAILTIKELLKHKEFFYAIELLSLILHVTYDMNLFSDNIDYLLRQDFCNLLNNVIEIICSKENYKAYYDPIIAFIYNYLGDKIKAEQFAEKYIQDNEGIENRAFFKLLRDIYREKGDEQKAEFYSNKLTKYEETLKTH